MNEKEQASVAAAQSLVIRALQEDAWRYRIETAEAKEQAATALAREAAAQTDIVRMQYQLWRWRSDHKEADEALSDLAPVDNEPGPADPGTSSGGLVRLSDLLPEFPTEETPETDTQPDAPPAPAGMKDNDLTPDGLLYTDSSAMTISQRFALFQQYAAQYPDASAVALARALNLSRSTVRNYRAFMAAGNAPTGRIYLKKHQTSTPSRPRSTAQGEDLPVKSLLGMKRDDKIVWIRRYRATFPKANQRSIARATKLDEGTLSKIWKNATPAKDERPYPALVSGRAGLPSYQVMGGLVEFNTAGAN